MTCFLLVPKGHKGTLLVITCLNDTPTCLDPQGHIGPAGPCHRGLPLLAFDSKTKHLEAKTSLGPLKHDVACFCLLLLAQPSIWKQKQAWGILKIKIQASVGHLKTHARLYMYIYIYVYMHIYV